MALINVLSFTPSSFAQVTKSGVLNIRPTTVSKYSTVSYVFNINIGLFSVQVEKQAHALKTGY
jgi:hypothetical protein